MYVQSQQRGQDKDARSAVLCREASVAGGSWSLNMEGVNFLDDLHV